MSRRLLIALPLVVVALLVVAAGSWWFFIRESNSLATSAPAIPTELVASTPGAGSTPDADATSGSGAPRDDLTFAILPDRSDASYFVGEKLAALPLPSTAKGSTSAIAGAFRLTPSGDLDPSQPATFTVDLTQLRSDKDMRDARVQSQGLQTQTFPKATFTATKVTGWDASAPAGQEQDVQLTGTLDLHGVQKEVTWDVKARHDGNVITALATTNFKFADFGIPILNIAGFVSIQDNVTLQIQVVAQSSQ
ncbi:MAG TPA: YceI family protein [Dehalococcoidia bacterium]|nr:YceI family protein [Dehalococcoidia bacterium]